MLMIRNAAKVVLVIPGGNRMRISIIIAILISIMATGCSRYTSPGVNGVIGPKEAGQRYDFLYVEALRNKYLGSFSNAVAILEECIKLVPERDGAYYQLAQLAYMTENLNEAKRYAVLALERNNNIWYYMFLANILLEEEQLDKAAEVYAAALKEYPDNLEVQYTLGNIYYENESYEEAARVFSDIDQRYGLSGGSAIPLVRSLIGNKQYEEAERKLLLLIDEHPEETAFLGHLAEMYRDKGDLIKAGSVYDILIEKDSEDKRTLFSMMELFRLEGNYRDYFGLLNSLILREDISAEEKVTLFSGIIENSELVDSYIREIEISLLLLEAAHENEAIVFLLKPELYSSIGRNLEAIEKLDEFVKNWPEYYYAWEKLIELNAQAENYEQLYAATLGAIQRFPEAIYPRLLNAVASVEIGFYEEVFTQTDFIREAIPGNEELEINLMTIEADALYRQGDIDMAFSKYEKALELNPDDLTVLNNYAYFLAEKGIKMRKARRMIEKVMERETDNLSFNDTYAWVLYKQRRYRKAEEVMREVVEMDDSDNAVYYDHLGYILKARRNCQEAVEMWKRALELDDSRVHLVEEIEKDRKSVV